MKSGGGYTLIELIVVVSVIAILTTIVAVAPGAYLKQTRDKERSDDVFAISRYLERSYTEQALGKPSYPTAAELATDISGLTRTMNGASSEVFQAPGQTSSSVVAATSTSVTAPIASMTIDKYVYQPFNSASSSSALCSGTDTCVRYNLYYQSEQYATLNKVKSLHQQ